MTVTGTKDAEDLLARHRQLADERRGFEQHWQDLGEVMLPRRADFTGAGRGTTQGEKRTETQFDGTPLQAARGLAAAIDGMLRSRSQRWFSIKPVDPRVAERSEIKRWLEAAEDILFNAFYDPRARFLQRTAEVDLDLVVFGTGALFVGERPGDRRLLFRAHHLKDIVLAENADGAIDTVFRSFELTARQAVQQFGEADVGEKIREAVKDGKLESPFRFLHAVMPRADRNPAKRSAKNMPFASVFVDVESQEIVSEGGYPEFPYVVPRWDTAAGEIYGRSPGMLALPDAKTLNQMAKTILRAGHKVVDPPLLMPDDGVKSGPRTWPGGITYYDADMLSRTGGRPPISPLVTGANIPLGREMQHDVREQVWAAFFRNVLQLPGAGPQMTATEIIQRKEEFIRVIGPTFGRLEADYTAPMVERAFAVLSRAGMIPPPPDGIDAGLRFDYASPITLARRQVEAAALQKTIAELAPVFEANPAVLDNFDHDRLVRDVAEANGLPQRWLKPEEQVAEERAEKEMLSGGGLETLLGMPGVVGGAAEGAGATAITAVEGDLGAPLPTAQDRRFADEIAEILATSGAPPPDDSIGTTDQAELSDPVPAP